MKKMLLTEFGSTMKDKRKDNTDVEDCLFRQRTGFELIVITFCGILGAIRLSA